jgi:hypothetical protein
MTEPGWWWEPLGLDEAVALMNGFPRPWWVAGGYAIELHVGRAVREHEDVDLLVLRDDQEAIRAQLPGWEAQVAHDGRLEPWPAGHLIERPRSGLWARRDPGGPWQLQLLLAERDRDTWWYRRDERIRLPLAEIGLRTSDGVPYLRPSSCSCSSRGTCATATASTSRSSSHGSTPPREAVWRPGFPPTIRGATGSKAASFGE